MQVNFDAVGSKWLVLSYAKLEALDITLKQTANTLHSARLREQTCRITVEISSPQASLHC